MKLRTNMKTISLFGRAIPMTFIVALMVIGIGSAALIANFFQVNGTVQVTQPVSLTGGNGYTVNIGSGGAGLTTLTIANAGADPILMELQTSPTIPGITVNYVVGGETLPDVDGDGLQDLVVPSGGTNVEVSVHAVPETATGTITLTTTAQIPSGEKLLVLDNKNPTTWVRTPLDGINGYVIYTTTLPTMKYRAVANGMGAGEYSLIYYADQGNRFVNWGGDNPGALLGTDTADSGKVVIGTTTPAIMVLPMEPDKNIELDYSGAPDYYATAHGAKLWLVPSSDYNAGSKALTAWNPSAYLFETDLINFPETP